MPRPAPGLLLLLIAALSFGCDNVGRAFDPDVGGEEPVPQPGTSAVQVLREGGDPREGRPKVRAAFPKDGGWPLTVPIVVEFSESVNEASIAASSPTALDGRIVLRVQGRPTVLPCSYEFLAAGRLLVMRPTTGLTNEQTPVYEVVLLPDARDADGVRFDAPTDGTVLTTFQVNQDESIKNGRILATFPRDNARDAMRDGDYFVIFDRPPAVASFTNDNIFLRTASGTRVTTTRRLPVQTAGIDDSRFLRLELDGVLAADTRHQLVVDNSITFPDGGTLDFRGRTPFAVFDTVGPGSPTAVVLGNAATGFANSINRATVDGATLRVTTPADTRAGDVVVARIYGGDNATAVTGDLKFVEREASATVAGEQEVLVPFVGLLGTADRPRLDQGEVSFAARMRRGTEVSGFTLRSGDTEPVFDVTRPSLRTLGPPSAANGTDLLTDQEHVFVYGTASEEVVEASLVVGSAAAVPLFGASRDGRFLTRPVLLGQLESAVPWSLTITDTAGNLSATASAGVVVQRGVCKQTGSGNLVVEVYDATTLLPIPDATVLVDPEVPTVPATGQTVRTTDVSGRVTLTGVAGPFTITLVRAGFDLLTVYGTSCDYLSLPLRPTTGDTATLRARVLPVPQTGQTVLFGCTAFDSGVAVSSTSTAAAAMPATAVVPNRPFLLSAFAGAFEPTALPAFASIGLQVLGVDLLAPQAPAAPIAPGGSADETMAIVPARNPPQPDLFGSLLSAYSADFGLAVGLDTANLVGGRPIVRSLLSLQGFGGQLLNGVGTATPTTAPAYSINANFGLPALTGLGGFGPLAWVTAEARDTSGNTSRHRVGVFPLLGTVIQLFDPPSIPTVTAPSGPGVGSPAVTFADTLDATAIGGGGGIGLATVTAEDPAGRQWRLLVLDQDGAGTGRTVQFPDLAVASVAGLATGTWNVSAETRVLTLSSSTATSFVLAEFVRNEVVYAKSAVVAFTVQ